MAFGRLPTLRAHLRSVAANLRYPVNEPRLIAVMTDAVDHVLPLVPPYEFALYLLLLRITEFQGGEIRIGKRSIGALLGKGTRSTQGNYQHITEKLQGLARTGLLDIGDTTRDGTRYLVHQPEEVPAVRERKAATIVPEEEPDFYGDPILRATLFERDRWRCRYCGEVVIDVTATLDHVIPSSLGGANTAENLATACLTCTSIKSGRTYNDAAPDILAALARRRATT